MDTPSLATAEKALSAIDPNQLDDATKIAFASAVAQIATANASFQAVKELHDIAEATDLSAGQSRRLGDLTTDLLDAVKHLRS